MKKQIKIAVRELVEHVLRSGDLVVRFVGTKRLVDGIRGHQKIQSLRPDDYISEVPVVHIAETKHFLLTVTGRIDGVYKTSKGVIIDEIKTTARDPDTFANSENIVHWAQAKIYAYIFANEHSLKKINVQLTYVQLKTYKTREITKKYKIDELNVFFEAMLAKYVLWAEKIVKWSFHRDKSITELEFPFPNYRTGQRTMAIDVYRTIQNNNHLILQAPTGIGKTMGVIFPGLKAMAEGLTSKIFYLTARTTGRTAAEQALEELRKKGLKLKSVTLTAKEKICLNQQLTCNPDECEFAKGHFDRINQALNDAFCIHGITSEVVKEIANLNQVCAFEFSLDLINSADFVICDYNYAFDPRVYLRRSFVETTDNYTFLIDEAHNLVDRSREMFSAQIQKQVFVNIMEHVQYTLPDIYKSLGKIDLWLTKAYQETEIAKGFKSDTNPPEDLYPLLQDFLNITEKWLSLNLPTIFREKLLILFFEVSNFIRVSDLFDDTYSTCFQNIGRDMRLKFFCIDPSKQMKDALTRCSSAIFFSATMTPVNYFKQIFGCNDSVRELILGSPFPGENLGLFVLHKISTLYKQRTKTASQVTKSIEIFIQQKQGNYLIFFPSYQYMTMIQEQFCSKLINVDIIVQTPGMKESERNAFLQKFSVENQKTLIGFAVMGGIFGEGIDLVGNRLTGAVIVSVGLPGVSIERELIRKYFSETINAGFEFAYIYPGINRVLQAAGRVIRSENEKGVVLLIDQRFFTSRYRALLPSEWNPVWINSIFGFKEALSNFWDKKSAPQNNHNRRALFLSL